MSTYVKRLLKMSFLTIVSCVVLAWGASSQDRREGGRLHQVSDIRPSEIGHIPIESIRVGSRVATYDSTCSRAETVVDPGTWKKYTLKATATWEDGTVDVHSIETLQPPQWAAAAGVRVGSVVPIPFDLREMGGMVGLRATVVAVEDCPPIDDGPGRVVLSTINHLSNHCRSLTVRSEAGSTEEIKTTDLHPFWSVTRECWVRATELSVGDNVQGLHGSLSTIISSKSLAGTYKVYNITVEGDHVYRVGRAKTLVHNSCGHGDTPDPGSGDPFDPNDPDSIWSDEPPGSHIFGDPPEPSDTSPYLDPNDPESIWYEGPPPDLPKGSEGSTVDL